MHHRRKPDQPITTRGALSRLVPIRLPYGLEEAIKEEAALRGRPWQTVLKELLAESLGLADQAAEIKRIPATALHAATRRLKKNALT